MTSLTEDEVTIDEMMAALTVAESPVNSVKPNDVPLPESSSSDEEEEEEDTNKEEENTSEATPKDERTKEQKEEDEFWASCLPSMEEKAPDVWPPEPKEYIQAIVTLLPECPTRVLEGMLKLFTLGDENPLCKTKSLWKIVDALCVAHYRALGFQAMEKIHGIRPEAFRHSEAVRPFLNARFAHESYVPLRLHALKVLRLLGPIHKNPSVIQALRLGDMYHDEWILPCLLGILTDHPDAPAYLQATYPGLVYDVLGAENGPQREFVQKIANLLGYKEEQNTVTEEEK